MTGIKNEKFNELKMLIVDDSKTLGMIIKDILMALGFNKENIEQVGNAYDALNVLESKKFDVMSSNLWMPSSLNGLELLERIRSHDNDNIKELPFMLITGETSEKFVSMAFEKGANSYLSKPFNIEKFKEELDKIFSSGEGEGEGGEEKQTEVPISIQKTEPITLGQEPDPQLKGMKVLIVDDSSTNITILKNTLNKQGFQLTEAPSGEIALKMLFGSLPDLILLDVTMSGIDGYETCRRIKNQEETKNIPVIFISSMNETENIIRGFDAGGSDYISKPFRAEEVVSRVKSQLQLRKTIKDKEVLIEEILDSREKKDLLIKELLILKEQLEAASKTDPLTEMPNRRGLNESLDNEKLRFERNKKTFCLVLASIDTFRKINDKYGHDAGDFVLVESAKIIKSVARKQDIVGRWGAQEFLALLPETECEGGAKLAEKLRVKIEEHNFEFNQQSISITMSFGVVEYNSDEQDIDSCINKVDSLLNKAKEAGRNQIMS